MTSSTLSDQTTSSGLTEDRLAWLALALTPQIGPRRILRAVERCGGPARILSLSLTELESLQFPAESVQFIFDGNARSAADQQIEALAKTGASFLTYADAAYPERLREIFDPPVLLWIRGNAELLAQPSIAVVGTRHPTPYGTGMAEMLSRDLATRGLVILSGMARGVDTAAHRGAIAANGRLSPSGEPESTSCIPKRTNHSLNRSSLEAEPSSRSIRWEHSPRRRIFPNAIAFSAE